MHYKFTVPQYSDYQEGPPPELPKMFTAENDDDAKIFILGEVVHGAFFRTAPHPNSDLARALSDFTWREVRLYRIDADGWVTVPLDEEFRIRIEHISVNESFFAAQKIRHERQLSSAK